MNKTQDLVSNLVQDSVSKAVGIDITHLLYYSIYESLYERVLYLVRNSLFYKTYDFLNHPTCIFIKISVIDKFGDKK